MIDLFVSALAYILPAYVANASAVVVHGRQPLDGDMKFLDGRPLLGRGKTVLGFFSGIFFGTITGGLQLVFASLFLNQGFHGVAVLLPFFLSVGAMSGDSAGSFIKRRFDLKPGQATPLLDQWDFIIGALGLVFVLKIIFDLIGLNSLSGILVLPDLIGVLIILVVTPVLHVLSNYVAFRLKFKGVPW